MASTKTDYAPDEFDQKAADVQHRGVHRAKVSTFQRVLPYALVFLLVGALVGGGFAFLKLNDVGKIGGSTPGQVQAAPGASGNSSNAAAPAPIPSATIAAPDPNLEVSVSNAGTISGMAAKVQGALVASGWKVPIVNSARVEGVTATTVLYKDDASKSQAEAVAHRLSIKNVVLNDKIASPVNVLILDDFGSEVPVAPSSAVTAPATQAAAPVGAPASPTGGPASSSAAAVAPDANLAIAVLNGNGGAGVATKASTKLKEAGWGGAVANGNAPAAPKTVVYYAKDDQKAIAESVAQSLGSRAEVQLNAERSQITVVVGADFNNG